MSDIAIGTWTHRDGGLYDFAIPETSLDRHAVIFGGSGSGKSYLSYVLIREQLQRGCSLVVLDPKIETIRRLRGACEESGIAPERVVTIDPYDTDNTPGFNPFRAGADPGQTAAQMSTFFAEALDGAAGPRMRQFSRNAFVIAAWHGLTIDQSLDLLLDEDYRDSVLSGSPLFRPGATYAKAIQFFARDFLQYERKDRVSSSLSVKNKFDEMLGNDLFLPLFGAHKNTVDFRSLFQRQGAVLACLDPLSCLGEFGAGLLGGVLAYFLQAASVNRPGDRPVVLAMDELGSSSRFLEQSLRDVANMARERRMRLLVSTQHPDQLPERMRKDLMESSAVKAYLRPGGDSAASTARSLATYDQGSEADDEEEEEEESVEVEEDDGYGGYVPLRYSGKLFARRWDQERYEEIVAEKVPPALAHIVEPDKVVDALRRLLRYAPGYRPPIVLDDARRAQHAFAQAPPGSVKVLWKDTIAHAIAVPPKPTPKAPAPPKPKPKPKPKPVPPVEYWTRELRLLENGWAVVVSGNDPPTIMQVFEVEPRTDASRSYALRSLRAQQPPLPPAPPAPDTVAAPNPAPVPDKEPTLEQRTRPMTPAARKTADGFGDDPRSVD